MSKTKERKGEGSKFIRKIKEETISKEEFESNLERHKLDNRTLLALPACYKANKAFMVVVDQGGEDAVR